VPLGVLLSKELRRDNTRVGIHAHGGWTRGPDPTARPAFHINAATRASKAFIGNGLISNSIRAGSDSFFITVLSA
jgi:hypothetical protein